MDKIQKARYILNILFLIGALVTLILYFATGGSAVFFYTGIVTMTLKMIEFILRFMF